MMRLLSIPSGHARHRATRVDSMRRKVRRVMVASATAGVVLAVGMLAMPTMPVLDSVAQSTRCVGTAFSTCTVDTSQVDVLAPMPLCDGVTVVPCATVGKRGATSFLIAADNDTLTWQDGGCIRVVERVSGDVVRTYGEC